MKSKQKPVIGIVTVVLIGCVIFAIVGQPFTKDVKGSASSSETSVESTEEPIILESQTRQNITIENEDGTTTVIETTIPGDSSIEHGNIVEGIDSAK
ncbi:hypothetical protein [Anaeromicropila populeti]|uniref:Uncharacterized protein n=1 Tax=Anaeromicropila populeti TaxID=37658 RepID=A0A1I6IT33_9FIRM|nr:hypothetical protein [Anaeromicropila populeti]SFR69883.1 hypothetical protein SAMN05661086_01153 [Anaeromicropila populeti]